MSTSGLSDLSSPLSSEDDNVINSIRGGGKIDHYIRKSSGVEQAASPAKRKRAPSPPHEYVLADNPDIAVICMFRSRFSDAFPKTLQHYGPQDIERSVEGDIPGEQGERLLCALLGLVLNRKKEVERGHFQRALEEAVQTHTSQWPAVWGGKNPLHGGGNFSKMNAAARLTLLKSLALWSLSSSEAIQNNLKESFKQQRHDDDLNQPLSVQPWGRDGDKRRYWLIEGQDDTHFRLYRESNPLQKRNIWRSIAGTIEELRGVAERLGEDASQASRRLRDRIMQAIPRFEASEEKRKRRDYRNARKAQFTRPELGYSLYEGRTRGKRIRYTFSDEEGGSDAPSTRRSNRHSRQSTPAKPVGPTFTASGRQVKSRIGGAYGETMLSGQHESIEMPETNENHSAEAGGEEIISRGRTRGSAYRNGVTHSTQPRKHIEGYNALDEMEDESDASSSGGDWDGADDDEIDDINVDNEDEDDADMSDDEPSVANDEESPKEDFHDNPKSLMVSLRYRKYVDNPSTNVNGNFDGLEKGQPAIPVSDIKADQENGPADASANTSQEKISTSSVKVLSTFPTSSSSFGQAEELH